MSAFSMASLICIYHSKMFLEYLLVVDT